MTRAIGGYPNRDGPSRVSWTEKCFRKKYHAAHSVEAVGPVGSAEAVSGERSPNHCPVIPVTSGIIRIPIERVKRHQTIGEEGLSLGLCCKSQADGENPEQSSKVLHRCMGESDFASSRQSWYLIPFPD